MSNKITKNEVIQEIQKYTLSKTLAIDAYNDIIKLILNNLKNDNDVELFGLGRFVIKTRAARTAFNPQTRTKIDLPEAKKVSFKPSNQIKNLFK